MVTAYACSEHTAELDFEHTRKLCKSNNANLARHCIQSFAPGEISVEDAHQLGLRLAAELTKGEYEYVLATHIDRNHIHNHLIINEINFVNGKSFSTEHDRKSNPAWKQLRSISDMLCEEYNLSVIRNPERGFSRSYYEWEQSKNKQSWKDKLRETIDDCIMVSDSFEDFLKNEILPMDSRISYRGIGMIWGLDFEKFGEDMTKPLIAACFKNGLILERVGRDNNVLKLMPPVVIPDDQLLEGLNILKKSLAEVL